MAGAARVVIGSVKLAVAVVGALFLVSCMDQYNPRPYWEQFKGERQLANRNLPKLTEKGEIPEKKTEAAVNADPIMTKYASLCASCHGDQGAGDGAAAASLNPKPRNFHDKAWQAKTNDERIHGVIKEGGAKYGLSAVMPPWGAMLSEADVEGLTKKIREWGAQ